MKKKLLALIAATLLPQVAVCAGGQERPKQVAWPFDGATGVFDRPAAQRGYQVYKEVCSACHSMRGLHYRNLAGIGFNEAEIKAIAADAKVQDGSNDAGEMFERSGRPSDKFAAPYPNNNAARAANNGALPPDLTLIVKARPDGANYVYSLLTGFGHSVPEGHLVPEGQYYNPYFAGGNIAMAPPLSEGAVTYQDGTVASVDQMARDVTSFLHWASQPEMEQRKSLGLKVLIFLAVMTLFMLIAMKRIWSRVKK